MSRGPGFIEREIIDMLRHRRRRYWLDPYDIANRAYAGKRDEYWTKHVAQHVAILRAMRSVARKFSDEFVLRGGKGRAWLVIMRVKHAPKWDDEVSPALRGVAERATGGDVGESAGVDETCEPCVVR